MPPPMKLPAAQPPPYLAAQTASRAGRPIEPWRDSLRLLMFVSGVGLLVVFATPLQTSPDLVFYWNLILHGEGTARLPPLMLAAVGVLGMIVAGIPMQPAARGLIAAVLGLAGVIVPLALTGVPEWQVQSLMIGTSLLVIGLVVRSQYRDAAAPRVLVTLGALGVLAPFAVPQHGAIPLIALVKQLIEVPGIDKLGPALALGLTAVVVLSLLTWLPGPVTGGALAWAWLVILWPLIGHVVDLVAAGHPVFAISKSPNLALISWIATGKSLSGSLGSAYLVLIGYGLASVVGKQLE
jgi:hypothetical protein